MIYELDQRLKRQLFLKRLIKCHFSNYMLKTPKRNYRLPGAFWVLEVLNGNPQRMLENARMSLPYPGEKTTTDVLWDSVFWQRSGYLRGNSHHSASCPPAVARTVLSAS